MNKTDACCLALVVWLSACAPVDGRDEEPEPVAVASDGPPNIVLLFADDMGYGDLGSYGHPYNRTPNLDTLAAEGQRWTDFYVAAPVCSSSRGALLTGRLGARTGLYGQRISVYFPADPGGLPTREVTLAESLKATGYRTGIFGKWHLGDAPHAWPTRHGFDEWLGLPYSNDMDWVDELGIDELIALRANGKLAELAEALDGRGEKYSNPKREYWHVPLLHSVVTEDGFDDEVVERPALQATLTKRYTEAAIDFMRRSAGQPFFVYLPYTMPHTPLFPGESFTGKSLGGRYGDVIQEIDWSVGEVKRALLDMGIANNTLVIFSSDNGPWLTMKTQGGRAGLLRGGKGTTYEGGMRVPTIFWWPEKISRRIVSGIGSTLDIFSTVAALSGADGTSAVDGMDLSPVLFGDQPSPRHELAYYRGSELYAYRQGAWKAHFVTEGRYGQPPDRTEHDPPQLFHLLTDPSERFDLAADNPDVLVSIRRAVDLHKASLEIRPSEFDQRLFPDSISSANIVSSKIIR